MAGLTLPNLSASKVVVTDADKLLISGTNTDAEISSAVTALHAAVTLGTANGLSLTGQELSLPTSATPTFAGASLTDSLLVAGNNPLKSILHGGTVSQFVGNNGMSQGLPATNMQTQSAAIAGTRTSGTIFTRTAGTWTADVLISQHAFCYAAADPMVGTWLSISDNDTTTITITGTIPVGTDTIKTCIWTPIQRTVTHGKGVKAFIGGVFDGKYVWCSPHYSSDIVRIDPVTGDMISYAHGEPDGAFEDAVFDGTCVWFVPTYSDYFLKLDPATGTMTKYAHGQGAGAFVGAAFDGRYLWFCPSHSLNLVKVDPATGTQTAYPHGYGDAAVFHGIVFDGNNLWMVPRNAPDLVKVAPATGAMTAYSHGLGALYNAFEGGIFDGQDVWLCPRNSPNVVKVNVSTGAMTGYPHGQGGTENFNGCVFDGQSMWLVPEHCPNVVRVSVLDGSIAAYAHGQVDGAFRGAVFTGQEIWLMPYSASSFVAFSPIGSGTVTPAHDAVTLGTANGLTLSVQVLSLPTTATPTFAGLTIGSNDLYVDTTNHGIAMNTNATNVSGQTGGVGVCTLSGTTAWGGFEFITQQADASDVVLGNIFWVDKNSTATSKVSTQIQSVLSGTTANNRGTYLRIFTKPDGGNRVERLRITRDGYFGFGVTVPNEVIEAAGKIRANTAFNLNGTDGATQAASAGTVADPTAIAGGIVTAQTQVTYIADGPHSLVGITSITTANGRITAMA